jgi:hypothetical protein
MAMRGPDGSATVLRRGCPPATVIAGRGLLVEDGNGFNAFAGVRLVRHGGLTDCGLCPITAARVAATAGPPASDCLPLTTCT